MAETTKQRNQVNVRLDDETNKRVVKIAAERRIKKSEVCRQAINGELAKIDARQNKVFTLEERQDVLLKLGSMAENISAMRTDNVRYGTNINQIAKAANAGKIATHPQIDVLEKRGEDVKKYLEAVAEELNRLWQLLA